MRSPHLLSLPHRVQEIQFQHPSIISNPSSSSSSQDHAETKQRNKPGPFYPALGGVTCTFKKEIKAYQKYEIWTRVVFWDNKWLYLISHFVKPGSRIPTAYSDQPRRAWKPKLGTQSKKDSGDKLKAEMQEPTVYATCMSKYAFKQGRITVPPEEFLRASGLLPDKPEKGEEESLRKNVDERRLEGNTIAECMAGLDDGLGFFTEEEVVFAKY